jgi:aspartyl-tRNA(Asn)/glutamyl-tRNA(Gln) amidotransferase subunit C
LRPFFRAEDPRLPLEPSVALRYNRHDMSKPVARSITPDLVRQVARLARLAPDEASLPKLAAQLESILDYVAKIGEANVAGVEPMAHAVPLHNVLRDDEPGPALPPDEVLRNAPETDGPFFKVPKVIGGDEDSAG